VLRLGPLVLVARAIGMLVPFALAARFGATSTTDALYYAAGVPTFALVVATGALGSALLPLLARDSSLSAWPVALRTGLFSVLLGSFFALLLPYWLPVATSFSTETQEQTSYFSWALVPFLGASSGAAILRTGCEARGRFQQGILGPAVKALTNLSGIALVPSIFWLPWIMGLGALLEASWYGVGQEGSRDPGWIPEGMGRILVGEGLVAGNTLVDRAFAGSMGVGAVSFLEYGERLKLIPQAFFDATLVTPLFSGWARLKPEELPASVHQGLRSSLLALPVVAGMIALAPLLVRLAYGRGAFSGETEVSSVLIGYLPGVWLSLMGAMLTRALVLRGHFGQVMGLGILSFCSNFFLDLAFFDRGVSGLAWATSLTSLIVVVCAWLLLKRGA
jgi:putative peptidoglycan lipid II flippase